MSPQPSSLLQQEQNNAGLWQIAMAVVQLPSVQTDLLITLNTPLFISSASAAAEHAGKTMSRMY
jgi:hypothetical protein